MVWENRISIIYLVCIAAVVAACGRTGDTQTEKVGGVEWMVTVNKTVEINDTVLGVSTNQDYTVADTAVVNALLKRVKHCGNISIAWTLPSADESIWLVACEDEPLISEKLNITETNCIEAYGDVIQVAFKFSDAAKWAAITRDNIGECLAVIVNGQVTNAPQVNSEITSGNCAIIFPKSMVCDFLPGLGLEEIKQK